MKFTPSNKKRRLYSHLFRYLTKCTLCLRLLGLFLPLTLIHGIDADATCGIARDVEGRTHHVENTIDACDESNAFNGQTDRGKNHGKHNHARTRYARCADRGEDRRQHDDKLLLDGQVDAENLSDEHSKHLGKLQYRPC